MIRDIFSDPDFYDAAYSHRREDVNLIVEWADRVGSPVLELAAGTGRLAIPLLDKGHTYTGLDLSPDYVVQAKKKLKMYGLQATIIQGDMRNFNLDKPFNFIFIGFNSILHLISDNDIYSCYKCVYEHLTDEGIFLIDCFVPNPEFLYRDENRLYPAMEFDHPNGGKCIVKEKNQYDTDSQINHIWWYLYRDGCDDPEIYKFYMHIVYPDTMDRLLTEAGFVIRKKLGDYGGSSFDEFSRLQIYVCGK